MPLTPDMRRDVDDHIDPNTRAWVTVDEDGNLVFPEATEQQQEQVGARFEAWLLSREDELTPDQERWLRTVSSQLRATPTPGTSSPPGASPFRPSR